MCSLNDVVVVMLDAILAEAIFEVASKFVYLSLHFVKRVTVLLTALHAVLCLKHSVPSS